MVYFVHRLCCCCSVSAFPFKTILACIKAGGRNKPSIGIKALPFSRSSGQTQWKQRQELPIWPKQIYHCSVILRCFRVVSNSPERDANWFFKLLLGPVYMEWGTPVWWGWVHALEDTKQKKPTPLDRGPPLHVSRVLLSSRLLNSRRPVRKSKFGTCAVTGYCSFNLGWFKTLMLTFAYIHSKRRKLDIFILYKKRQFTYTNKGNSPPMRKFPSFSIFGHVTCHVTISKRQGIFFKVS